MQRRVCCSRVDENSKRFDSYPRKRLNERRRQLTRLSLAVVAALAMPGTASAARTAIPAGKFYSAIGINAHGVLYPANSWPQRLVELGIQNVRGRVGQSTTFVSQLGPFFANGGKITTNIVQSSGGTLDKVGAAKSLAFLKTYVGPQRVAGIEGPNEFNNTGTRPVNWATVERDYIKWQHDTVRADSAFNSVPLIAPSVWTRLVSDYKALGDLSLWVDKGCIHYYSGFRRPTLTGPTAYNMVQALRDASMLSQAKPIWMTETGWMTAGNVPMSQRAQAKYVLRDYFDAFGNGVEKVFDYQLMDDDTNLYGITDASARPKLAFYALKNLAALVKDSGGGSGALDYTVTGAPTSLKQMLLQKSDGSFLLVLWLDVDSYNLSQRRDIETMLPATINLARPATVEVYQPTFSAAAQSSGSGQSIPVFVGDQITVVRIH